jgi:CBS domain-containing protein
MTRDVRVCHPRQSICDAAKLMAELDCGILPVGDLATAEVRAATEAVSGVSRHGGPHSQSLRI